MRESFASVCKSEQFKKDIMKAGHQGGNGNGSVILGKSVTFAGLPPSTSPDSSPVSTPSIVSSMIQHLLVTSLI